VFDPYLRRWEKVMDKKYLIYAGLILLGVYFSAPIKSGLHKIPVVGPKIPA
jgi:hypothetical protein